MYIVINDKKYDVILMNSFFTRFKGLMFRKDPISDIYMFPKCSSIHTFFMKQEIDVCILDKNFIIKHICHSMKRGRILIKKGYYTLEMPLGTAKHLHIGEKVTRTKDK